jgi:biotin synthase
MRVFVDGDLREFTEVWADLAQQWRDSRNEDDPLASPGPRISSAEKILVKTAVQLLNSEGQEAQSLFASARKIRDLRVGPKIDMRAVVDLSNKCRVNCSFCPMRRDNSHAFPAAKATAEKIVLASQGAYEKGFRQLFLQSGEDPTIIRPVIEALNRINKQYSDWHIILNFGNHRHETYAELRAAGAHGYLIKHETASPQLHYATRGQRFERRVQHMLLARKAGLYIGSGNILGLPGQSDEDLARDLIFLGRINSSKMASCAPFTPSHHLPTGFQTLQDGTFGKALKFIALLRHCFPHARIPATSNLDSPELIKPKALDKSGQAMAIDAGANGLTVQFTPPEIESNYGLYARGSEKMEQGYLVRLAKAKLVSKQTGLPLDLKDSRTGAASDAEFPCGQTVSTRGAFIRDPLLAFRLTNSRTSPESN